MDIKNVLCSDFMGNGVPEIVIIGSGTKTYLFVNGEQISAGCQYVSYLHDVRNGPCTPILATNVSVIPIR